MHSNKTAPKEKDIASPEAKGQGSQQDDSGRKTSIISWAVTALLAVLIVLLAIHQGPVAFCFSAITFAEVILLFNILIIVHELGHFLAAKWCGLKIDKFAIWFGKSLWSRKVDGVEYILGSIPAGGYVALPQMANPESIEGKSEVPAEDLPPAAPWQKIIVAFAGPLFSFGLALFFACIVWVVGRPVGDSEATTTIGYVLPESPAEEAHLQAGDKIISIDNHPISRFGGYRNSVTWRIASSTDPTIPVVVQRNGQTLTVEVTPRVEPHAFWQRSAPRRIGIAPATEALIVKKVVQYSPVAMAGIVPGDQVVALNGHKLYLDQPIFDQIKDHPNDSLTLTILHQGITRDVTVTPEKPIAPATLPKDGPQTDIGIDSWAPIVRLVHPDPLDQVGESAQAVISTIEILFTPHSTVGASQLSGPLGIMNIFSVVLSTPDGWRLALWFAVLINVNLAMLNLLPFPILDGGHITLSIIEWIRRRPLSMSILEPLQTVCALVIISYMAYVTFFDAQDSFRLATAGGQEIKFAPKPDSP
ncbi:MAG: RIP metalloprotease RseP [Methylacidiphilales bacterium]|nr:RIP metalloprotease RseP [Candidatus Methylacidiphilales bacterium]